MMSFFSKGKPQQPITCMDVVDAYGATIECLASSGRQMHSVGELPYEKPLIEVALLTLALRGNTSAPESVLKIGYMELSTFHESGPGVSAVLSGAPPSIREELEAFMRETSPKMARQAKEMEAIVEESTKRSQEWDQRLAAMRSGAHA